MVLVFTFMLYASNKLLLLMQCNVTKMAHHEIIRLIDFPLQLTFQLVLFICVLFLGYT
jgi:hypothetical protein